MSKSNNTENNVLKLIFQAASWSNVADNATTSPNTNLYVALHTADPADAGNQSTSEISYSGYARVAVARSTAGWTVVNGVVSPMANISFATVLAATAQAATHFSIGMSSTGTTDILYSGSISPQVSIAAGVVPVLTTATTISED